MESVIITRQLNLVRVEDMRMDKNDVKHVKSLFIMKVCFVLAVICAYVNPRDIQN